MKPITVVLAPTDDHGIADTDRLMERADNVECVVSLVGPGTDSGANPQVEFETLFSGDLVARLLETCRTEYLLLVLPSEHLVWGKRSLDRLVQAAEDFGAGLVYSDFREDDGKELRVHPLLDYQTGSIRDNFDFGGAILISRTLGLRAVKRAAKAQLKWGGLYDLRLKLSEIAPIVRLPEALYSRLKVDSRTTGERVFDYVNPAMREYQLEMEAIATCHLKRIGAFLEPEFVPAPQGNEDSRVVASVIIPVRNREATVNAAVASALSQETRFAFNVVVVDNHSTDKTTELLAVLAASDSRVIHLVPDSNDLGIGGCWNAAIYSAHCGKYAVQLDSDDLYSSNLSLQRIVDTLESGRYAMVIGSYRTVDFELNELAPGLVDHREWSRDNGRNNALRISGLGAPRAFNVAVLRQIGFPNVSYGEDYAVALRLSRDFEIGRIYDSLYLARRWGGNSDSALPLETMNRYDYYKDSIRSQEISARQRFNGYKE